MSVSQPSFESVLGTLAGLVPPTQTSAHDVRWFGPRLIGVARSHLGHYEVFVPGQELSAASLVVAQHLHYGPWRDSGGPFQANRIQFPSSHVFIPVCALVVEELFRAGLGVRPLATAFLDVEPLLELALKRLGISDETVLGLCGELLVLRWMLAAEDTFVGRDRCLDAWHGWGSEDNRDFIVRGVGVEVKTTGLSESRHSISSFKQVSRARLPSGSMESDLFLLSIGLRRDSLGVFSLVSLVDQVLGLLAGDTRAEVHVELQGRFLDRVKRYPTGIPTGYDHVRMREWPVFLEKRTLAFEPRLYDIEAPECRMLRADAVSGLHVVPESVRYSVLLPPVLLIGKNPIADAVGYLTGLAGGERGGALATADGA